MSDTAIWDAVADLFAYPEERATPSLRSACLLLVAEGGPLGKAAAAFWEFLGGTPPTEREELFTRTFDINPACTLELGWHLYGEDYQRGAFLVDMRQTLRALGVEETGELPDHLVHALRALGRLVPFKASVFSTTYVQPALRKMLDKFADDTNPWHGLLVALAAALESEHGAPDRDTTSASAPAPYAAPAYAPGREVTDAH